MVVGERSEGDRTDVCRGRASDSTVRSTVGPRRQSKASRRAVRRPSNSDQQQHRHCSEPFPHRCRSELVRQKKYERGRCMIRCLKLLSHQRGETREKPIIDINPLTPTFAIWVRLKASCNSTASDWKLTFFQNHFPVITWTLTNFPGH